MKLNANVLVAQVSNSEVEKLSETNKVRVMLFEY